MLNKIKKIFGIGDDTPDTDDIIQDDPAFETPHPRAAVAAAGQGEVPADAAALASRIFATVVREFNASLPAFLRDSVDPQRQQQYLLEALEGDVRAHLADIEQQVARRTEQQWSDERDRLQADIRKMTQATKDIENRRAELKAQQLSSDRQRRALNDRVHDLEKRLLELEAEKEQFQLEIKSLTNKVKVARVHEKETQSLQEHIAHLQGELAKAQRDEAAAAPQPDASQSRLLETLNRRITDLKKENEAVRKENDTLKANVAAQQKEQQQAREQDDNQAAALQQDLDRANVRISTLEQQLAQAVEKARTDAGTAPLTAEEPPRRLAGKRRPRRNMTAALDDDDLVNGTDWIMGGNSTRRDKGNRQRRPDPKNDEQMSLW